jgi:hypothetical protein
MRGGPLATLQGPRTPPAVKTQRPPPTDGGDGGHDLAELQLVQDGGLAGSVQPHLRGSGEKGCSTTRPGAPHRLRALLRALLTPNNPPTMRMRISFFAISRDSSLLMVSPMSAPVCSFREARLAIAIETGPASTQGGASGAGGRAPGECGSCCWCRAAVVPAGAEGCRVACSSHARLIERGSARRGRPASGLRPAALAVRYPGGRGRAPPATGRPRPRCCVRSRAATRVFLRVVGIVLPTSSRCWWAAPMLERVSPLNARPARRPVVGPPSPKEVSKSGSGAWPQTPWFARVFIPSRQEARCTASRPPRGPPHTPPCVRCPAAKPGRPKHSLKREVHPSTRGDSWLDCVATVQKRYSGLPPPQASQGAGRLLLLAGHRLRLALARARVGLGALPADGQALAGGAGGGGRGAPGGGRAVSCARARVPHTGRRAERHAPPDSAPAGRSAAPPTPRPPLIQHHTRKPGCPSGGPAPPFPPQSTPTTMWRRPR